MNERLEEIKSNWYDNDTIEINEVPWLIQQVERVEELEKENRLLRFIAEENKIAYEQRAEQNKRYREARKELESLWNRTYEINANEYKGGRLDGLEIAMNIIDKALEREG